MKRERILVIAADKYLASQMGEALRQAGYSVWRASDEVEGLKKLRKIPPDLVIIERELLPANREDPCSCIRQASYVPIIAVSGGQCVTEILESGADAHMSNPPNLRELTARVRTLLRRKNRGELVRGNLDMGYKRIIDDTY